MLNPIISCTTRPIRENEIEGLDYHFISLTEFTRKVLKGEMLEATEFREWFYGTPLSSLVKDKINIGVFNPDGIKSLLADERLNVQVFEISAPDKQRLLRYLLRENNPDCAEMCRRYFTDEEDFSKIAFNRMLIENPDGADLNLLNEFNNCDDIFESMWNALDLDREFETITRWESTMSKKAESENDKDNDD